MLGKPKFKKKDIVHFNMGDQIREGYIFVVDPYGTFEQTKEVSYDIMVEAENCLYKHIPESYVWQKKVKPDLRRE